MVRVLFYMFRDTRTSLRGQEEADKWQRGENKIAESWKLDIMHAGSCFLVFGLTMLPSATAYAKQL